MINEKLQNEAWDQLPEKYKKATLNVLKDCKWNCI